MSCNKRLGFVFSGFSQGGGFELRSWSLGGAFPVFRPLFGDLDLGIALEGVEFLEFFDSTPSLSLVVRRKMLLPIKV